MRCVDVTILVNAFRDDAPDHEAFRGWLLAAARDDEMLGLPTAVIDGFLRVVTHPRVFSRPTPVEDATRFVETLLGPATVVEVRPDNRHRQLLHELVIDLGLAGNDIPDASLAALAIELDASFWSADRGFARFGALRWHHPLDGRA